jgi:hypothetical protein
MVTHWRKMSASTVSLAMISMNSALRLVKSIPPQQFDRNRPWAGNGP